MKSKLKKNTFIQGTLIASISLIMIKILGALYVIPFYKIIGESGGTLYSYAYSIYSLFLNISTALFRSSILNDPCIFRGFKSEYLLKK